MITLSSRYIPFIALFILGYVLCCAVRWFQNIESFTSHQAGWFLEFMHSCPLLFLSALLSMIPSPLWIYLLFPALRGSKPYQLASNQSIKAERERPAAFHYVR